MLRPTLEVADILRDFGPAWRRANAGHVSLDQLKVMSAIERCRTAALGGHVARCENAACGHTHIAYNSCRNRHCPKCQGAAARDWLAESRGGVAAGWVFSRRLHAARHRIADIAYQNKRVIYGLLFKATAETMLTIAGDPKHLGAKIGVTSVLHTWGSAMTHHPQCPHDCAGRWTIAGWLKVDSMPAQVLSAGAGAIAPIPAIISPDARDSSHRWSA